MKTVGFTQDLDNAFQQLERWSRGAVQASKKCEYVDVLFNWGQFWNVPTPTPKDEGERESLEGFLGRRFDLLRKSRVKIRDNLILNCECKLVPKPSPLEQAAEMVGLS